MTTLSHSLAEGGAGAGVVCANFYPQLVAWLCANYHTGDDALVKVNYPASAKVYVATHCGVPIGSKVREGSPWPEAGGAAAEEGSLRLAALKSAADELSAEIGLDA